ncbi:lanthionine synthetase C family protein [Amycolatopsis sp.]|jgi:lantibiotic modifying enzyme|uniref:lanthionine synthetase C family protein n=1 Tax=Amycolatopsis sp. TaxID=37632 RepID=UPI002E0AE128|nr:lanthionine synthetase C family protein [Amycolatopsis sp.]
MTPVDVRRRAAEVAELVAGRLADPARVRETACTWSATGLGEGHPGVAVLFASLPDMRQHAHAHLAAATHGRTSTGYNGLFGGDVALAFAAQLAATSDGDYRSLRDTAADTAVRAVDALTEKALRRENYRAYDTVTGLTGLGRYLLAAGREDELRAVLTALVSLAHPHSVQGREVPGWWVASGPSGEPEEAFPHGHFGVGLAHGVAGPLALLSLATHRGIIVADQHLTIEAMAWWLAGLGPRWPRHVAFDGTASPALAGWCDGTPGVARALQLAGFALAERAWTDLAVNSMRALLARPRHERRFIDASLCHGAAGLLHITGQMAADSDDPTLLAHLPILAADVLTHFDDGAPFGFRYHGQDRAGLLEGAAGTALALAHFAAPGTVPWDAALLLA